MNTFNRMSLRSTFLFQALILLAVGFSTLSAQAKSFNLCLAETQNQHRIERDENILTCFKTHKTFIGSDNCYLQIRKLKAARQSGILTEQLKAICFYEASIFQNMKTCVARAREFTLSDQSDEAILKCYDQFQGQLKKQECLNTATQLTYPNKKEYLRQHCQNSYN